MKKLLLAAAALLFASPVLAAPAPLGLEIGRSTIAQARSQYKLEEVKEKAGRKWFRLEGAEQDGLLDVLVIANRDSTIHSVVTLWPESDFDRLLAMLTRSYELVKKETSSDGSKSAVFQDGDTGIVLATLHDKPRVGLSYTELTGR